jgi:gamma-glutamyl hydrolase
MRLFVALAFAATTASVNNRPIVGILSEPRQSATYQGNTIAASYVTWLESAGARVAVIDYTSNATTLRSLLASLNGILLQGSGTRLQFDHPEWMSSASLVFDTAQELALPIWGTCFGFELLALLVAGNSTAIAKDAFDSVDYMANLEPTAESAESRIFAAMPSDVRRTFEAGNATVNSHNDGLFPSTLRENKRLHSFFAPLATSVDRRGREFVALMEARAPRLVFASQFHPEKSMAEFAENPNDPHTEAEVGSNQWLARFFVGQARENGASFRTQAAEQAALIYNYSPRFIAKGASWPRSESMEQLYFLDAPRESRDASFPWSFHNSLGA